MNGNYNTIDSGSRLNLKDKKRKINRFYNIAITIVIVLILAVGGTILFSGGEDSGQTAGNSGGSQEPDRQAAADKETDENQESESESESAEDEEKAESEEQEENSKEDDAEPELKEIEENDSNVEKAYTSEEWAPVGTEQTGEHVTDFTKGSADWNEMTRALSASTGIGAADMTIWWLENGGSPNTAIGTVSSKNDPQTYRVFLEWVEGSGWKAVKVHELKENDKK